MNSTQVHFKKVPEKKQTCSNVSALIDGVAMGTREAQDKDCCLRLLVGDGHEAGAVCGAWRPQLNGSVSSPWELKKCCVVLARGREWVSTLVICL